MKVWTKHRRKHRDMRKEQSSAWLLMGVGSRGENSVYPSVSRTYGRVTVDYTGSICVYFWSFDRQEFQLKAQEFTPLGMVGRIVFPTHGNPNPYLWLFLGDSYEVMYS